MSYRDQLSPWCIIQLLPQMQRFSKGEATPTVVARFRKRNDAEAHLQALRRLNPALQYEIVFDPFDPLTEESIEATNQEFEELAPIDREANLHPGYFLE